MKDLAAYLLLKVGGNDAPSADEVLALMSKAGVEGDSAMVKRIVENVEGKDISELIASCSDRIFVGGGGGGGGGSGSGDAAAAAGDAAPAAKEKPKEEEIDFSGGVNMFGGGEGGGDY